MKHIILKCYCSVSLFAWYTCMCLPHVFSICQQPHIMFSLFVLYISLQSTFHYLFYLFQFDNQFFYAAWSYFSMKICLSHDSTIPHLFQAFRQHNHQEQTWPEVGRRCFSCTMMESSTWRIVLATTAYKNQQIIVRA